MTPGVPAAARQAPVIGRLRVLTLARAVMVLATVLLAPSLSRLYGGPEVPPAVAVASALYALLTLLVVAVLRWRPDLARHALHVSLVADVAWGVAVLWPTAGVYSPLLFLLHLQAIAVTVLFGWRTGLQLVAAQTLGFLWLVSQRTAEIGVTDVVVGGVEVSTVAGAGTAVYTAALVQALLELVSLWVVFGATAYFSSVSEAELRRSVRELAVLRELNTQLERSLGVGDVSQAIARGVVRELGYARAVVWTRRSSATFVATGADGFPSPQRSALDELPLAADGDVVDRAASGQEVEFLTPGARRPAALTTVFGEQASLVVVPLAVERRLLGLLTVEPSRAGASSLDGRERDLRVLGTLATEASLALDNARLHAELRDLATTDALTGVHNHRYFHQRLQEELDRGVRRAEGGAPLPVSLILMDIDHFKQVNDRFGHLSGDGLLRTLADLMQRVLRSSDVVCRYGGEEFGIILPDTERTQALHVAGRLREAIERSAFVAADGGPLGRVTASFGVATVSEGVVTRGGLIAKADHALYAAKGAGRNRVVSHRDGDTEEIFVGRFHPLRAVEPLDEQAGSA